MSILPSLLGFTLGGYALLVGFLGEHLRKAIAGPSEQPDGSHKESPFIEVNATFVHFVLVQVVALIFAHVAKAWHGEHSLVPAVADMLHVPVSFISAIVVALWGFGYLLYCYAMTLFVAAVMAVFRVGTWIDKQAERERLAEREAAESKAADAHMDVAITDLRTALQMVLRAEQMKADEVKAEQFKAEQEAERLKSEQLKAEQEVERLRTERLKAEQARDEHRAEAEAIQAEVDAMEADAEVRHQHK